MRALVDDTDMMSDQVCSSATCAMLVSLAGLDVIAVVETMTLAWIDSSSFTVSSTPTLDVSSWDPCVLTFDRT